MGYIYKITNIKNGKCYIGETIQNYKKRWRDHIYCSKNDKSGSPVLVNAFKKHGIDNFKFEVLIICFDDKRFEMETHYIKKYNSLVPNGYNICLGGKGISGFKFTDEMKQKLKDKQQASEKWKEACQKNIIGKRKGEIRSEEIKRKISEGMKKYRENNKDKSGKKVLQYSLDGQLINTYPSIAEAGRQLNITPQSISKVIHGQRKTCRGFLWKFEK